MLVLRQEWKEKSLRASSPDFLYDIFTRFRDLGRFLQIAHATPIAVGAHRMFNKHTSSKWRGRKVLNTIIAQSVEENHQPPRQLNC